MIVDLFLLYWNFLMICSDHFNLYGSMGGVEVWALASHHCAPGSIRGLGVMCTENSYWMFHLGNEVCFPCFYALMKIEVRLGEFGSRSAQTRDVVECLDLLECIKTRENILHFFYKIIFFSLNQQNKEFASKQNFNILMIKIYFLHTSQEPIRKLDIWLCPMKHG
jgi:hypothetical protein